MQRIWISMVLAAVAMTACGGKVVVDRATGNGGAGGSQATPVTCPGFSPLDNEIMDLVGKPCLPADQICASNNGCGGCSVTCADGVWTSTDAELCFSVGGTC